MTKGIKEKILGPYYIVKGTMDIFGLEPKDLHTIFIEDLKSFFTSFGTPAKILILAILKKSKEPMNVSMLHRSLKDLGLEMAYKNVLWTVEQLKNEKLIFIEKDEKNYNSSYIHLNEPLAKKRVNNFYKIITKLQASF